VRMPATARGRNDRNLQVQDTWSPQALFRPLLSR
jgi:hypothetical protein